MLITQLLLVVSISVATANVIPEIELQNSSAPLQVNCGSKVCKNSATCKNGSTCVCLQGTTGNECEVVTGCTKLKDKCDRINTECIYDTVLQSATCKCTEEKQSFNGESCADCDCGEFVTNCVFSSNGKYCFCKKGYADKYGKCSECDCGEGEDRCDYFESEKSCMCKFGYVATSDGKCTPCSCGPKTKSCGFQEGGKYCICEEGYKFKLGTCEVCDCGENSTSCVYSKAEKICSCIKGNKNRVGTCTHCECGPDTICQFTSTGEKNCVCIGESCRDPPTPWFKNPIVIVCIVILVGIVILIPGFVAYRKLRR